MNVAGLEHIKFVKVSNGYMIQMPDGARPDDRRNTFVFEFFTDAMMFLAHQCNVTVSFEAEGGPEGDGGEKVTITDDNNVITFKKGAA